MLLRLTVSVSASIRNRNLWTHLTFSYTLLGVQIVVHSNFSFVDFVFLIFRLKTEHTPRRPTRFSFHDPFSRDIPTYPLLYYRRHSLFTSIITSSLSTHARARIHVSNTSKISLSLSLSVSLFRTYLTQHPTSSASENDHRSSYSPKLT